MEHTNKVTKLNEFVKNNKELVDLVVNVSFIVAIFVFCFLLVFTIIVLVKNADEITKDPIIYGMEKSGYTSCMCHGPEVKKQLFSAGDNNAYDISIDSMKLNEVDMINGAGWGVKIFERSWW